MNRPTAICGTKSITLQHPITWNIPVLSAAAEDNSLNGTLLKDVPWRKYQYILKWPALNITDYNLLEDLVNVNNDYGLSITFQYDRWRNTTSPILVSAKLLNQGLAAGCYREVELILTEEDPREQVS